MERSKAWIDKLVVFAIASTVFFLALSPLLTTASLGVAILAWAVKLALSRGKDLRRAPFDSWVLGLVILSAASILVSPDMGFSFYNYYNLMGRYLLLYYLIVQNITTLRQVKLLTGLLAAAAAGVTFYGFYQYFFGIDITNMLWVDGEQFPELKTRVFSTLQNPNILAGYLLVMMLMAFGVFCKIKRLAARVGLVAFFMLMGACLAMTYCRGAWISLLLVVLSYGAFKNRRMLVPLFLIVAIVGAMDASLAERLASAFSASDTSSSMRLGIWESTISMIIEHPLLGIGWGSFWMVYPAYDFFIQNDAVKIVHAHNMYLNFAAEIGLVGCFAFLGVLGGHLSMALSNTRLRQSNFLNGLTLGCALSMIGVAINGLTDYVLFNIELSMLFWVVCAFVVIICRRNLD